MPRWQLTKINEKHHLAARLFTEGLSRKEVCRITGYSPWQMSKLWNSPAFQALLLRYQGILAESVARGTLSSEDQLTRELLDTVAALRPIRDTPGSAYRQLRAITLSTKLLNRLRKHREKAPATPQPDEIRLVFDLPPALAAKLHLSKEEPS